MKHRKRRFSLKINEDTLTSIVVYSLLFCVAVTIAGLALGGCGHDVAPIIESTHRVFGTELGICGIMKCFQRWTERRDHKTYEDN